MRIVVTGASGNVGTSVVRALGADDRVAEIVGITRRTPAWSPPRTRWESADVARDDLVPLFRGADVVIHLAWLIQPSRDGAELERVNVDGSRRVFEAAAEAGVGALVHASSIGVYRPAPRTVPSMSRGPARASRAPSTLATRRPRNVSWTPSKRRTRIFVSCGCAPG